MRRGWMRIAGWTLATGAMIGMSWYGVHSVLAEPARPAYVSDGLPVLSGSAGPDSVPSSAAPSPSATRPTPSARPSSSAGIPSARPAPRPVNPATTAPATPAPPTGEHTYTVEGGSVVLALGPSSAALVSATPDPGWRPTQWNETGWIRVLFTNGHQVSSVICSWKGHPPTVQTYTN